MFVPATVSLAFGLLILTMFCWGSWTYIRSFCTAQTPVFCQLYFLAQLSTALFFCFTLGSITYTHNSHDSNFDDTLFLTAIRRPGAPAKVFAIFLGGHFNAHADFLCALACSVLPFGVAFPVYAGWGLAQGTVLDYFVLGSPGNPAFLFSGVCFALLAIALLAYSDSYDSRHSDTNILCEQEQSERSSYVDSNASSENSLEECRGNSDTPKEESSTMRYTSMRELLMTDSTQHHSSPLDTVQPCHDHPPVACLTSTSDKPKSSLSFHESKKWLLVCIFAGILNGLWSPLSSLGTVGKGAVTNDFVSLFIFQFGQFSSLPIFLNYYGMGKVFAPTYIWQLCELSYSDIFYGLAAGIAAGIGFTFYFIASSVISSAISFSIGACCPLFTLLLGVIFARQLVGASLGKCLLLAGTFMCYVVAITLIAASKSN